MGVTYEMKPRAFCVFEGLDGTGKTTQMELLRDLDWEYTPRFLHQPSGDGSVDWLNDVYKLLEGSQVSSPLARQLLHLACHSEMYRLIVHPTLTSAPTGIFLDRFWWSTWAYGMAGGIHKIVTPEAWMDVCRMPLYDQERYVRGFPEPDLILYFDHQHQRKGSAKGHNQEEIAMRYKTLASVHPQAVTVPVGTIEETHDWIMEKLLAELIVSRSVT